MEKAVFFSLFSSLPICFMFFGKKSGATTGCYTVFGWVVSVLFLLATLASLVGVYKSHFLSSGATFGTTSGSLALIAFVLSLTLWKKSLCCCCGEKK